MASARHDTVLVREGDGWKVAIIREWDRDVGFDASLKELDWLVGNWRAVTGDREITLAYKWDENKAFIRGNFSVKEGGKVVESGTHVIGKDPARGAIRWWVFQSDGGFGGGAWAREGKRWAIDVRGVRADGKRLVATILYAPVDADTFTWQVVNQSLDGVAVADTPPTKVTKKKSAN